VFVGSRKVRVGVVGVGNCASALAGPLDGPSSYFMKSPPRQFTDQEARERTRRFIEGGA
jgi:myo-inositol-1-phosphate synthase